MCTVKVRSKVYEVPTVEGQSINMTVISFFAEKFYESQDAKEKEQFFEVILTHADSIIKMTAFKFEKLQSRTEDLIETLKVDLWRLINSWVPTPETKFHYLMLRQLRNKAINETKYQRTPQEQRLSLKPSSMVSMSSETMTGQHVEDFLFSDTISSLDSVCYSNLLNKLLENISDGKTRRILELQLEEDYSLEEIRQEVGGKALRAIKRRQEACRPILISLVTGSYNNYMHNLLRDVPEDTDKIILQRYCSGKTLCEISEMMGIDSRQVKECVEKYRTLMLTKLN